MFFEWRPCLQVGSYTLRRSFLWLGSASALSRLVDLGAIIVVLRFVSAKDVGAASAAWTVTTLLEPFASLGVSFALITMRRLERRSIDTAIWLSLFGGLLCACLVALSANFWGTVFGSAHIVPLVVVSGLKLIPMAFASVPQQRLARALKHRELAAANACSTLMSAAVRVYLAMQGFGAWSFVFSQLAYAATLVTALWWLVPMRPRLVFSNRAARHILALGMPSSAGTAVGLLSRNLDMMFVSRWFGIDALGLYRVAFDLAVAPMVAVGDVVARSAAPTLRRLLRDPKRLRETFGYAVKLCILICLPLAVFVATMAPALLTLAKDPSFVAAAPVARVLVFAALLLVVFGLFGPLAQAVGHPELGLWSNLELFVLLATSLWVCLSLFGPFMSITSAGIAWCLALTTSLTLTGHRFLKLVRGHEARLKRIDTTLDNELPPALRRVV